MIRVIAAFFTRLMQRWMPDAFLFALFLTFVVFACGVLFRGQSPVTMIDHWGSGVWKLLSFSMQVMVTLVTGHVLAQTPLVQRLLQSLAGRVSTPGRAIVLVTAIALIASWISWGFGLIVGALIAREVGRRVQGVHYPWLVASAYSGLLVWSAGLSGSIPLKIAAAEGDAVSAVMGGHIIPVSQTIFSWQVMTITLVLAITLPLINRMMMPAPDQVMELPPGLGSAQPVRPSEGFTASTPAERIEHSPIFSLLFGALAGVYVIRHFLGGGTLSLNTINLIFLSLGVVLHVTPANYLAALNEAIKGTAGIVLQFPLYAGIMGMMVDSGLAASVSSWFVAISTPTTFPLFSFLSAGLVNFFVPSGGGQWAVQAPIIIPAAEALGVPLNLAAMSVAFGDAWTNMVQPFWAIPLLAIAGLGIKDIMGYCTVCLLWSGLVYAVGIVLLF